MVCCNSEEYNWLSHDKEVLIKKLFLDRGFEFIRIKVKK
jgi:hypothetical protein